MVFADFLEATSKLYGNYLSFIPISRTADVKNLLCSQNTEASMLAARYVVLVWPGLLMDWYADEGENPDNPTCKYYGETVLHLAIVNQASPGAGCVAAASSPQLVHTFKSSAICRFMTSFFSSSATFQTARP